jgi:DNA-binding transcriptional MerR regulator
VKISELSRRSGVTIATIKYYIREGLLASGDTTARNQALYDGQHLADLALIRALRDRANLSITAIRRVLEAVEGTRAGRHDALETGFESVQAERLANSPFATAKHDSPEYQRAWRDLQQLFQAHGWEHREDDAAVQELLAAMTAVSEIWPYGEFDPAVWENYAALGERAASFEIPPDWDPDRFPAEALRYAIVGTYLFEPVILAFRRLALTDRSNRLQSERRREAEQGEPPPQQSGWLSALSEEVDASPAMPEAEPD